MNVKIVSLGLSALIMIFVLDLVRREKLAFKYALGWLCVSCLAIFFALFDDLIFFIAHKLGFELPSNFIFFVSLFVVVLLSLSLTIFLCQQNSRNDCIAQKLGLLEEELERLKKKVDVVEGKKDRQ